MSTTTQNFEWFKTVSASEIGLSDDVLNLTQIEPVMVTVQGKPIAILSEVPEEYKRNFPLSSHSQQRLTKALKQADNW